jgi:hypothetical protein
MPTDHRRRAPGAARGVPHARHRPGGRVAPHGGADAHQPLDEAAAFLFGSSPSTGRSWRAHPRGRLRAAHPLGGHPHPARLEAPVQVQGPPRTGSAPGRTAASRPPPPGTAWTATGCTSSPRQHGVRGRAPVHQVRRVRAPQPRRRPLRGRARAAPAGLRRARPEPVRHLTSVPSPRPTDRRDRRTQRAAAPGRRRGCWARDVHAHRRRERAPPGRPPRARDPVRAAARPLAPLGRTPLGMGRSRGRP